MPLMADELGIGPTGYGFMLSAIGVGAVSGTVLSFRLQRIAGLGPMMLTASLGSSLFVFLFAWSPIYPLSVALTFCAGVTNSIFLITSMTVMQLRVPEELRGRVMGIHAITFSLISLGGAGRRRHRQRVRRPGRDRRRRLRPGLRRADRHHHAARGGGTSAPTPRPPAPRTDVVRPLALAAALALVLVATGCAGAPDDPCGGDLEAATTPPVERADAPAFRILWLGDTLLADAAEPHLVANGYAWAFDLLRPAPRRRLRDCQRRRPHHH